MVRYILNLLFTILGICIIASLPTLFRNDIGLLNFSLFFQNLSTLLKSLLSPFEVTYLSGMTERNLLENILPYLKYSIVILTSAYIAALLLGITFGIILTFNINNSIRKIINVLGSIPDITIFFFLQWIFLLIYKKTGILLFQIAGGFENSYFIPIISLMFIPLIYFFRITILLLSEEMPKNYIEFAKSKGISKTQLIKNHLFPNIKLKLYNYLKPGFWYTFSNLVILELIFNIQGIIWFILNHQTAEVIAFSLILFLIPWNIFFVAVEAFMKKTKLRMNN
ncbi:ABC transporter permease subunit [Fictibacillus phosphorivorans]|uniref:ABC transporter permease subunit n=1 Tax=Fictibacillus phosphorivorans TaxID=1221500 RepID=UPI00203F8183|nr:ABC transporter permease subunit [Fictibacillus phosphorivorans]MCM3719446.1 ABC transporter permease subunit [Fictibacillus phosphorivorans]MCM3777076.1 ABC transporter permease subunit [Fictibacillus phosphorivorans]